jgi:FtsP/CotA-like multicopper oxidase with cupredoxin domain
LVSVDGNPVVPLTVRRQPLAVSQRADIVLRMPADGTAVPVFAIGEGRSLRTGTVNDQGGLPATIDKGQRVELVMRNRNTMMAHPMHHLYQMAAGMFATVVYRAFS